MSTQTIEQRVKDAFEAGGKARAADEEILAKKSYEAGLNQGDWNGENLDNAYKLGKEAGRAAALQEAKTQAEGMKKQCPECGGQGFKVMTAHGCDGSEQSCAQVCPVPEQEQCNCYFTEHNKALSDLQAWIDEQTKK